MAEIILDGLTLIRVGRPVVDGLDLRVRDGEVLVLGGPDPGPGTAILEMIEGGAVPDDGRVLIDGRPPASARGLVIHVGEAPATPNELVWSALLNAASASASFGEAQPRALDIASRLELVDVLHAPVVSLTELQRQRLAIALATLAEPQAILLDQPTSGLEDSERSRLADAVGAILSSSDVTAVYATTDGTEALRVADRIAYFSGGDLQQIGTPTQLALDPATLAVAQFVGGDQIRIEPARLTSDFVDTPAGRITRPDHVPAPLAGERQILYATWPMPGAAPLETRGPFERAEPGPAPAAGPALAFDPDTGARVDRVEGPAATVYLDRRRTRAVRYLNVVLARRPGAVVPPDEPLEPGHNYRLELWIGARAEASIVANAEQRAFPEAVLPNSAVGHQLQVVAHSAEVHISRQRRGLFLPARGDSRCISIGFTTPDRPAAGTIRLALWYRRHILQSVLVDLVWRPNARRPSHTGRIDYTVTDLDDLTRLPERDLSLVVNETSDVHRIIVNGRGEEPFGVTLFEAEMETRLTNVRTALLDAHRDATSGETRYDDTNAKDEQGFIADLKRLAHAGAALLEVAFPSARRRNALVRRLREASAQREGAATVQIAQATGGKLQFPWHVVYDIGLEVFAKGKERPCPVLDAWRPHVDPAALPRRCPYEHEHTLNTICPFGFWGFAHILELPPSTQDPTDPLPLCVRRGPLVARMATLINQTLDAELTRRHLERLPAALPRQEVHTRNDFKAAMAEPVREVVYLYCHGRRKLTKAYGPNTPLLEIGDDDYVATGDIAAWASIEAGWPPHHWDVTRPLVVINGCHTAEVTPMQPSDFVGAFMGAGAAGVVGTEIMLDQPVASEAAERLLANLLEPASSVGSALQAMRRTLLAKGNVMGLVYTPYCSASLSLQCRKEEGAT